MTYTVRNLEIEDYTPPDLGNAGRLRSLTFATRAATLLRVLYNLPEPPTITVSETGVIGMSIYASQPYYNEAGVRLRHFPIMRYRRHGGGWVYSADVTAEELWAWADWGPAYDDEMCGLCRPEGNRDFYPTRDCYWWENDDEGWHLDPERNDDEEESEDGISGYHNERRDSPRESYDMAVELEVFDRSKLAVPTVRSYGHIAEYDGSLDTGGYEIVQRQPRQMPAVIADIGWQDIVSKLPSQANRTGYGMHVSVNALGWKLPHETTFVAFWTANEDLVCSFAGRRYCESYAQKGDDVLDDAGVALKYSRSQHRYAACSVRGGGRIEVRLFRTTRQWHIFAGRVQIVDAVARWAAGCGDTATHKFVTNILGSGGLLEWMKERADQYAYAIKLVEQWAEKEVST